MIYSGGPQVFPLGSGGIFVKKIIKMLSTHGKSPTSTGARRTPEHVFRFLVILPGSGRGFFRGFRACDLSFERTSSI
jgi:hypothetical protein